MGSFNTAYDLAVNITDGTPRDIDLETIGLALYPYIHGSDTAYLVPADTAAENDTNLQAALDDTSITTIRFIKGIYDFQSNLYIHGEKNIIGEPGVIWRPDFNVKEDGDDQDDTHTIRGYWIHIGPQGFEEAIVDWTGEFSGIRFEPTENTFLDRHFWIHGAKNCIFKDLEFEWSDDIEATIASETLEAMQDEYSGVFTSGVNWNYAGSTSGCTNITFDNLYLNFPQAGTDNAKGGEGIAMRGGAQYDGQTDKVAYKGCVVRNCVVKGMQDDPIAIHSYEDVRVHDNCCESVDGRILMNHCSNAIVANNRCKRIPGREGTWKQGGMIETDPTSTFQHLRTFTGSHTGANNQEILTDDEANDEVGWEDDVLVGYRLSQWNVGEEGVEDKWGTITANTQFTVTATVYEDGGGTWDWDTGKDYRISGIPPQTNNVVIGNIMEYPAEFDDDAGSAGAMKICSSNTSVIGNTVINRSAVDVFMLSMHDRQVNISSGASDNRDVPQQYRQFNKVLIQGNVGMSLGTGILKFRAILPYSSGFTPGLDWEQDIGDIVWADNIVDEMSPVTGRLKYHGNIVAGGDITASNPSATCPDGLEKITVTSSDEAYRMRLPLCIEGTPVLQGVIEATGFELNTRSGSGDKINGVDCSGLGTLVIPANSRFVCTPVYDSSRTPVDARLANWIVEAWDTTDGSKVALDAPD